VFIKKYLTASKMNKLKLNLSLVFKVIRYNIKIIFAGKFLWFLLGAFAFFIFVSILVVLEEGAIDEGTVYDIMLFPGLLLIFYPTVYGIQNDADARVLEILFGIPDYRFRIFLVRLAMIWFIVFLTIVAFTGIASILLAPVNILEVSAQLMFPISLMGALGFWLSAGIRNGNGSAVVLVSIGLLFFFFQELISETYWYIYLNPLDTPFWQNELVWRSLAIKNRIFLTIATIVSLLAGMMVLQRREKFL